jgi:CRISPR-associated protein Cas2
MLYVVSYDMSVDKRRTKLAKLLEGFGQRVQYSVFECDLTTAQFAVLWRKVQRIIKPDEGDSVRVYRLCGTCVQQVQVVGNGPAIEQTVDVLVV